MASSQCILWKKLALLSLSKVNFFTTQRTQHKSLVRNTQWMCNKTQGRQRKDRAISIFFANNSRLDQLENTVCTLPTLPSIVIGYWTLPCLRWLHIKYVAFYVLRCLELHLTLLAGHGKQTRCICIFWCVFVYTLFCRKLRHFVALISSALRLGPSLKQNVSCIGSFPNIDISMLSTFCFRRIYCFWWFCLPLIKLMKSVVTITCHCVNKTDKTRNQSNVIVKIKILSISLKW